MTATKKILTIDRSKWYRGKGGDDSFLLSGDRGDMCCLGFDALARGLTPSDIKDCGDPSDVAFEDGAPYEHYGRVMLRPFGNSLAPAVQDAIKHNDAPDLTEPDRERLIREDLIALGWDDVLFVDEVPAPRGDRPGDPA